jgi:FAD/FMN-containing dehydrogenase
MLVLFRMWWISVLCYLFSSLLLSSCVLCRHQWTRVPSIMILVLLPTLFWYFRSPVHFGHTSVLKSVDRPSIDADVVRNWAGTVSCAPRRILSPQTVTDVRNVLAVSKNVRVVAGGHSWTPLICSDDTVITLFCKMSLLENTTAVFDAGCSIRYAQEFLQKRGRMLHGYGSIQEQTLAGGFMTALHGVQFESFASNVKSLDAVLANGTLIQTDDIYHWQGSMGMLGVVVRMSFNTFPSKTVLVNETMASIETVIETMSRTDIIGMDAKTTSSTSKDIYNLRTFSDPHKAPIDILHEVTFESFVHDNVVLPMLLLMSRVLYRLPIARWYYPDQVSNRVDITNAWYRFPEFGFKSAEYSIPLQHCSTAVREIRKSSHLISIQLRHLRRAPGCLSWVQEPSCLVDTSFIDASVRNFDKKVRRYHERIERIVFKYGGYPHWGKFHVSQYPSLPCMNEFKALRLKMDPTGKFMNEFTISILNEGRAYYPSSPIEERALSYALLHTLVIFFLFCVWVWPTTKRSDYKGTNIRYKHVFKGP